jgi:hypothetical protein
MGRSRHAVCMVTLDHQLPWASAFATGLRRHGWSVAIREDYQPCDLLVKWGVRDRKPIEIQRRSGGEICILERGYLGDRFKWASVSFGGELNGRAEFRGVRNEPERFDRNFAGLMQPWNRKPGYALLIGQVPGDMSIAHADIVGWYRVSAARLRQQGWQVRFRPHPVSVQRGIAYAPPAGVAPIGGSLAAALAGAGVVVTFSSNAAVEAVLAGVPTIACDPGSMARAVAAHSVADALITPDRGRWASELAWKQFTAEEMASGDCWAVVSGTAMVAS